MTAISGISDGFAPRDTSHPFIPGGLTSFSSLLASARSGGPRIDLGPGDARPAPGTSIVTTSSLTLGGTAGRAPSTGATGTAGLSPSSISSLPDRAHQWLGPIEEAAHRHGVDPKLLTALVWTESAFRIDAISPAGAIGLGQLMPGTARGLGVDPYDPIQNLDGAANYISQQLRHFGSVDLALAAYNAGPGRVMQSGGVPNIAETQAYVRIVGDRYDQLSQRTS